MTTGKTIALTRWTFVGKVMSLLFNMLSRLVITFLPRSKRLNFMAAVTTCSDFGAPQNKVCYGFHCFPIYLPWRRGSPVLHYLLEFAQIHIHRVSDAVWPSRPLCPLLLLPSNLPESGSFPMSQFFASGGQSIGVSASASVLPMNIQNWFPLGWISLPAKGLSKVFCNTTVQSINSSVLSFLYSPALTTTGKTIALTRRTFVGKVMSLFFIYCLGFS